MGIFTMAFLIGTVIFHKRIFSPIPVSTAATQVDDLLAWPAALHTPLARRIKTSALHCSGGNKADYSLRSLAHSL